MHFLPWPFNWLILVPLVLQRHFSTYVRICNSVSGLLFKYMALINLIIFWKNVRFERH